MTESVENRINISEIFLTIQGEGRYLGHPAIFIRTSGCNLRCRWGTTYCDTPHTSWSPEGKPFTIDKIVARVHELKTQSDFVREVVITGGEPLLQRHLQALVTKLANAQFLITLETNGTMATPLDIDFVSLSPKLATSVPDDPKLSANHESLRYNKDALLFWIENYRYQLKFVVDDESDENEILEILDDLKLADPKNVYLMPQGISTEQLKHNGKKCIAICLKHGWIYTPRAHIDIFGNIPGT